ncbi:hypothetical protein [Rhizobium sp. LC145]|uniref:hypothetical protein n=1 Tax=Rhizobium sp. LC145 TaxID=1120688 RepID=UPI00062A0739|nr:hypothetical protein [Rhizobium sp. LC145]KKX29238.1 hypothetical protein YH62_15680 [Rhizobium sp. LC145]TKT68836.1 hypothetical protein FDR95_00205 [Rhizobiaceae bacterium LC148]
MRKLIFPLVLALLQPAPVFANFDDPRTHGADSRQVGENPACEEVNRAYMRTANSGRYIRRFYELRSNGVETYIGLEKFADERIYSRFFDKPWREAPRPFLTTMTAAGPVIWDCRQLEDEVVYRIPSKHFRGHWRRGKKSAYTEIWIGKEDGRFTRTLRRFDASTPGPWGLQNVIEEFDYGRDFPIPFPPFELP